MRKGFETKKIQPPISEKKRGRFFSFLIVSERMVYPDPKFLISNLGSG